MATVEIKNGELVCPQDSKVTSVWIKDGFIVGIGPDRPEQITDDVEILDAGGCYVSAGLIDLQVNGDEDCDLWSKSAAGDLEKLCGNMLSHGVTTFLPTLITDSIDSLVVKQSALIEKGVGGSDELSPDIGRSRLPGFHLEGPFLSAAKPGVHPSQSIVPPTTAGLERLVSDQVLLVTMACEEDKSGQCLAWLRNRGIHVSIGHSNATQEEAEQAFKNGVRLTTHLFNAMPAMHHRNPGLVGAALLDKEVHCCLIADGLHLSPAMVDLVYRLKGVDKTILVTDIAHVGTKGGDLVGSSITLDAAVRNLVNWGICSFADAVRMATISPARAIGIEQKLGSIEKGKLADLICWQKSDLAIKDVILSGARK